MMVPPTLVWVVIYFIAHAYGFWEGNWLDPTVNREAVKNDFIVLYALFLIVGLYSWTHSKYREQRQ